MNEGAALEDDMSELEARLREFTSDLDSLLGAATTPAGDKARMPVPDLDDDREKESMSLDVRSNGHGLMVGSSGVSSGYQVKGKGV